MSVGCCLRYGCKRGGCVDRPDRRYPHGGKDNRGKSVPDYYPGYATNGQAQQRWAGMDFSSGVDFDHLPRNDPLISKMATVYIANKSSATANLIAIYNAVRVRTLILLVFSSGFLCCHDLDRFALILLGTECGPCLARSAAIIRPVAA